MYQNEVLNAMVPYISNWERVRQLPTLCVLFLSLLVAEITQPTVKFGMKMITPNKYFVRSQICLM